MSSEGSVSAEASEASGRLAERPPARGAAPRETPAPAPHAAAAAAVPSAAAQRRRAPDRRHADVSGAAPLLDHEERDRLTARLHHAVSSFVDEPQRAVEEADHVFEEAARYLTDALARRRQALREPWSSGSAPATGTEELRLALRQYKEATDRLLKL